MQQEALKEYALVHLLQVHQSNFDLCLLSNEIPPIAIDIETNISIIRSNTGSGALIVTECYAPGSIVR